MFVRLLAKKISQWARENFCRYCKKSIAVLVGLPSLQKLGNHRSEKTCTNFFFIGPFSLQGRMKEVKPKKSHSISNNKAQFTRQIVTRPGLKIRNVKNDVSRSILGPGFLVNRVKHSHKKKSQGVFCPKGWAIKFILPLMMLFPERVISIALHVMLGTVMRTTSLLVCVDQIRISALAQVRIRSELSLKTHTQAS